MSRPSGADSEISSIGEDYLKAVWSATEWGGAPVTTTALAERFGVTVATASDTVRRLAAQGFLSHEPYRAIELTPAGERQALRMVRRHRLIEAFLVTALGYRPDEVHDEAEVLEHAVSDLMIDRIDRMLGHPDRDPHGDPIPAADGTVSYPADAVRLAVARPGRYRVTRISDADPALLGMLQARGFAPGAPVQVIDREGAVTLAAAAGLEPDRLDAAGTDAVMLVPV